MTQPPAGNLAGLHGAGAQGLDRAPELDLGRLRAAYPALSDGRSWLDGAAGAHVSETVIGAIGDAYRAGFANSGGSPALQRRSAELLGAARRAVAAFCGGTEEGVVFGASATELNYRFADALSEDWQPGHVIVLTELDHEANRAPWVQAARRHGVYVRTARIDPGTGTLPVESVTELLDNRVRLLALPAASHLLGTIPQIPAMTAAARQVGAISVLDGVHHAPHRAAGLAESGADFYTVSGYKWGGPHVSAVLAAQPQRLEEMTLPRPDPAPDAAPGRLERGAAALPQLAGLVASVEHWAGLMGPGAELPQARRAVGRHEDRLGALLRTGLHGIPGVRVLGVPEDDPGQLALLPRTPTVAFTMPGLSGQRAAALLAEWGVMVWYGHCHAPRAVAALGVEADSVVRASANHYTSEYDVRRLLDAVARIVRNRGG